VSGERKLMNCCEPGCGDAAVWEIRDGHGPDEYTHSCTKHVGVLLLSERTNVVTALKSNSEGNEVRR
jgi:hypothetical protein